MSTGTPNDTPSTAPSESFTRFEFEGWEQVAGQYDGVWSGLTKLFIPALLDAVGVRPHTRLLDVACGPGYVAEAARLQGATVDGVDFSPSMISIAEHLHQQVAFQTGDAQALNYQSGSFDAVVMNFGVLHLSAPERAFAEAARVLRRGGRYAFSLWAGPAQSPGAKVVEDAIKAHAELAVDLPPGPAYFAYESAEECRPVLRRMGFDMASFDFHTITRGWQVPTAAFLFDAERNAGVRTTALLAAQSPAALAAICNHIEHAVQPYATSAGFLVPFDAHLVAISTA